MKVFRAFLFVAVTVCGFDAGEAVADSYPSKPVRIIVPFAPGGTVDGVARIIGAKLTGQLNQPFVVESRPGAGGSIGADVVARSTPDGYTILHNTVGQAIAPAVFQSLPFDTLKDLTPITQVVASTLVLVVSPGLGVKTTGELIARAKLKPGTLNYGMSGVGTPLHVTMEMLKSAAGVDIQGVPYRGDALVMNALVADEVQMAVVALAGAKPLIEAGKIIALATTGSARSPFTPELPTIAETVPGFEAVSWQGLFAPAKTPAKVVELIQSETAKALRAPDVVERLRSWTYEPVGSRPEDFARYFRAEVEKYGTVVRDAKIPQQK
jgi:tripartite-type tricarboxylate transporter receptor subunit TctC